MTAATFQTQHPSSPAPEPDEVPMPALCCPPSKVPIVASLIPPDAVFRTFRVNNFSAGRRHYACPLRGPQPGVSGQIPILEGPDHA
jgi:hypothetical protein